MKSYLKIYLRRSLSGVLLLILSVSAQGFSVNGTKLMDANGNEFIMRGVNYAYAWYTGTVNQSLPAIADAGANTVRIVLADGDEWNEVSASEVETLLDVCEEQELIAVLEVHDATGDDNIQSLRNAADYFIGLQNVLEGKEDRVIINIANEWYGSWDTDPWADGYIEVIETLRNEDLTHTIMIDCAGYGQYPASVHERGTDIFNADPLENTMFSIHMYEYSGGSCSDVQDNIDQTLSQGLALCIGEFGHQHSDGDVAEQCILDHCEQEGVGWLAWSWHGNSDDVGYLDLATDASGSSLTDWGNTIVNGTNGLKETAQAASIFSSVPQEDNTPPEITLYGGETLNLDSGANYEDPGCSAEDETDGDLTNEVTVDDSEVNTDIKGTYTVTYTVSDAAGNTATAERTVIVGDSSVDEDSSNASLLDDFEDGGATEWGGYWYTYNDSAPGGASTVEPVPEDDFSMSNPGYSESDSAAMISFTLDEGDLTYDPFVGMGVLLDSAETDVDISMYDGIRFAHKGSGCVLEVVLSNAEGDANYQASVPSSDSWSVSEFEWGDFEIPSRADNFEWDATKAVKLQWKVQDSDGTTGEVWIDDVEFHGSTGISANSSLTGSENRSAHLSTDVVSGSSINVRYNVPESGFRPDRLSIFNISGRNIYSRSITNVSGNIKIEGLDLSSGMYFIRLSGSSSNIVRKIMIDTK